jgi:catecholate siderophore receptor
LIYQPTDEQSYYVSYGTSFNPSLEQLTATLGQQNLAPETNKSYEAGAKWDLLKGNLSLTTAVFDVTKDNARQLVSTGVYALAGDIEVKGVELGAAGRITRNWQVFAGLAVMNPRIIRAVDGTQGNVPSNVPHDSASLWTTYKLARDWETGGGVSYMSNRYAANNDVVTVPRFIRYDAMLAYHQPKYDLRLNLLNLFNRRDDFDAVIPSDGGRSVPTISRTLLATVAYRF